MIGKTCEHCRRPFGSAQRRTRYCSTSCAAAARVKPRPACEACGDPAELGRRFCSYQCSVTSTPAAERFWTHVEKSDGCWVWRGATGGNGYGKFMADTSRAGGRARTGPVWAHRFAYELLVGPIPDGLVLDHLCCVPLCVNPAHLEPVTVAENTRRAVRVREAARR